MWRINLLSAYLTVIAGTVMLIRLRFFFFVHPIKCIRRLMENLRIRSYRRSLALALAGTLGVGNIYGVALGIILGGEGSVLWLFVSSVFAMAVKYSESVLATHSRSLGGGMMIPIEQSFGRAGKYVAKLYALFMLLLSLFMGSFIQADSLVASAVELLPVGKLCAALIFLMLFLITVLGGGKRIKSATEAAIPFATVFYCILSLIVIMKNYAGISAVFARILTDAMRPAAVVGGALPIISSRAFSQGFARGVLSNEAGAGTSAMAHSEENRDGVDAGLFGIVEIFFDTDLLCMLTALVILLENGNIPSSASPMELVFSSFRNGIGSWSLIPLLICIALFAYSTVICWYYYGARCLSYLGFFGQRFIYAASFSTFLILPVFLGGKMAVDISDILLFLMSVPTVACIFEKEKNIALLTRAAGLISSENGRRKSDRQ